MSLQFDMLRNVPKLSQFLVDLLNLIEGKLLKVLPENRATCDGMLDSLTAIHVKCLRSEEYCVKPVPSSERIRIGMDFDERFP